MAKNDPEILEMSSQQVEQMLERAAAKLSDEDADLIRRIVESYAYLTDIVADKSTSIARLRKLLFGSSSEKTDQIIGNEDSGEESGDGSEEGLGEGLGEGSGEASSDSLGENSDDPNSPPHDSASSQSNDHPPQKKTPAPGHGRHGADDYAGADQVQVSHPDLAPGDACPECQQGRLYEKTPKVLVRFVGQSPLHATVYRMQKLRCHLCGKIFTAAPPEGVGDQKYDHTVASMIGLLKYGNGLPFNRLQGLQGTCEIPLAASTQWEIVHAAAAVFEPVFEELIWQAAQAEVVHNDDTKTKILELMGERFKKSPPPEDEHDPDRTGLFTSCVLALLRAGMRIALFFSGRRHAGENLAEVLKHRAQELDAPIHMCDALSQNLPKELETILANCLAHGRRYFVDLYDCFPDDCRYVIEAFKVIYYNDKVAREEGLSAEARLAYHQAHSKPTMDKLYEWLQRQLDEKLVEPNSGLGKAISYLLKRWDALTLFLRKAGAPLDNNICERALKKAILHRKNSLFYKTRNGARVGDIFMSLIYTCELNEVNPFDYLNQLQLNATAVAEHPERWLPWNYQDQLAVTTQAA